MSPSSNYATSAINLISNLGVLTPIGVSSAAEDNDFGVYDSRRNKFYTMDDNVGALEEISLSSGAATTHSQLNNHIGDGAYLSNADRIFHTGETGANLYSINAATPNTDGTLTGSFGGGRSIVALAAAPTAAPEPGALSLFALGGFGWTARTLRRRRSRAV